MKKTILFLWGFICILFFVSCSKEQLKPATGNRNQSVAPRQTVVNDGHTVPPTPPGTGGSSIIQKGTGHTGVNGTTTQVNPPPPPPPPPI